MAVVADASDRATVVEVRAADSPGLLHRLLRRMESAGARVQAAKVSTLGSDVDPQTRLF